MEGRSLSDPDNDLIWQQFGSDFSFPDVVVEGRSSSESEESIQQRFGRTRWLDVEMEGRSSSTDEAADAGDEEEDDVTWAAFLAVCFAELVKNDEMDLVPDVLTCFAMDMDFMAGFPEAEGRAASGDPALPTNE